MKELISPEQISERVAELGREITSFYSGKPLTVVAVATGGIFFCADLVRRITMPLWIDVISVSSYEKHNSSGVLNFRSKMKTSPAGREILLVDEVLDSGLTLCRLIEYFRQEGAAGVRTAVMFDKGLAPRKLEKADWSGFSVPDVYLVGYGLDDEERYRNIPGLAVVDQ